MTGLAIAEHGAGPSKSAGGRPDGDTAERILLSGINEFGRFGFAGASTARIVEAAGCNVRMLYHYFGSKDGLYRAALDRVYSDLRTAEQALAWSEEDPGIALAQFVSFTFDYMLAHPDFPRMMRVENMIEGRVVRDMPSVYEMARPLMTRLTQLVDRGLEQGTFRRRLSPEQLYLNILGLSFVHISNQHTASMLLGIDFDAPAFRKARLDEAITLILAGLRADGPEAA